MTHINWFSDDIKSTICGIKGPSTRSLKEADCKDCKKRFDGLIKDGVHCLQVFYEKGYSNTRENGCSFYWDDNIEGDYIPGMIWTPFNKKAIETYWLMTYGYTLNLGRSFDRIFTLMPYENGICSKS